MRETRTLAEAGYQCAGCGEWNETTVDESAGGRQSYVEDCQVCCKPNVLEIRWSPSDNAYVIRAELES
jgi:Cysteine-rich CPXCG